MKVNNENANKNEIIYACEWSLDKVNSWSGTNLAVRNQLEKYFNVKDFDYGPRKPYAFFSKVIKKVFNKRIDTYNHYNKIFNKKYKSDKVIFQFSDLPYNKNGDKNKHFIYQDLSWGYVKYICDNNQEIFEKSGFNSFDKDFIYASEKRQTEFYEQNNVKALTMSHWLKDWLINSQGLPKERVVYVGGGINIDTSKIDSSKKSGNKFLFVGKDFERKNGPLVVEAFKLLKEKHPDYELYIAGPTSVDDGSEINGLHYLGRLSFNELIYYFNLCDVFVLPSIFEAYGLVFAEALAFGLPCIGRNAYEMPYFIQENENGYLLKDDKKESLAEIMEKAMENNSMRQYVIAHSGDYINKYSWDSSAKRMVDAITNVIKNK